MGGFPALPLMEDIAFSRRLKRVGRVACLRATVVTSARRWQRIGLVRTVVLMWALRLAYYAGVPPATLARTYAVPVRVHPADSRLLYLGVAEEPPPIWLNRPTKANGAIMRSADGGVSWQQLTGGFPSPFESMVECIEFDPAEPDHVYAGTGGEGARYIKLDKGEVFRSVDRGDHWEQLDVGGEPPTCVLALILFPIIS